MQAKVAVISDYLTKMLGLSATIANIESIHDNIDRDLANLYEFYQLLVNGQPLLLVYYSGGIIQNPSTIRDNLITIREKTDLIPVYACQSLTRDARRDLITYHVSFLIPNQQLYIPDIGISFKEAFTKQPGNRIPLTSNAQIIVLEAIWSEDYVDPEIFSISEFADKCYCSVASASRLVSRLSAIGALSCDMIGKEKICLWTCSGRNLWDLMLPYLANPVVSTHIINNPSKSLQKCPLAGTSALNKFKKIGEPKNITRACSIGFFNRHKESLEIIDNITDDAIYMQVWKYEPVVVEYRGYVDPLSLYLSMKDDQDDRTQMYLKEMLDAYTWKYECNLFE